MSLTILYVEDNRLVSGAVKDTLEAEGWRVTLMEDGLAGRREVESTTHYDVILLDQELPHVEGCLLVEHARALPHRRHTPIIIMSAGDCGTAARAAGADAFLQKPEGIHQLVTTITRLLNQDA
ncbi:MAG: response regulator [Pyrinomonadaceae bacterium]